MAVQPIKGFNSLGTDQAKDAALGMLEGCFGLAHGTILGLVILQGEKTHNKVEKRATAYGVFVAQDAFNSPRIQSKYGEISVNEAIGLLKLKPGTEVALVCYQSEQGKPALANTIVEIVRDGDRPVSLVVHDIYETRKWELYEKTLLDIPHKLEEVKGLGYVCLQQLNIQGRLAEKANDIFRVEIDLAPMAKGLAASKATAAFVSAMYHDPTTRLR